MNYERKKSDFVHIHIQHNIPHLLDVADFLRHFDWLC